MKKRERGFEFLLLMVGLVGLLILFTVLFAGPSYIFNNILGYFQG